MPHLSPLISQVTENLLVFGNPPPHPLKASSTHEEEDHTTKANCIVPQECISKLPWAKTAEHQKTTPERMSLSRVLQTAFQP